MAANRTTRSEGAGSVPALRAIGYLRVSTRGQAERGMGLESQRERVRQYARQRAYRLIDVVQEAASGGVRGDEELSYERRPVLQDVLERARRGDVDAVIVARFDRLSRDYASLIVLKRKLQRLGVELHSALEENGDGPIAEFIQGQLALVAQLERAMILDRVREGKAQKKRKGRHVHGRIPFGYVSAGSGALEVQEATAGVVRRIFDDARHGDSPGRIARALDSEEAAGRRWNRTTVRNVVANPVYCGERYGVKRAQPAIVSRQIWNAANAQLRARARS